MIVIAVIWALLMGYAFSRGERSDPPGWWAVIAFANVLATIAFAVIQLAT